MSVTHTFPGIIEIERGAFGSTETIALIQVTSEIWVDIGVTKPRNYFITPTAVNNIVKLPIIGATTAQAELGHEIFIVNSSGADTLTVNDNADVLVISLPAGRRAALIAQAAANTWFLKDVSECLTVTLQDAYDNSAEPEILLSTTQGAFNIVNDNANTAQELFAIHESDGAGAPTANDFMTIVNMNTGSFQPSVALLGAVYPTAAFTVAIGSGADAQATRDIVIGDSALASAVDAIAIGSSVTASATDAIAIGHSSTASQANAIVIGENITNNNSGAVAITDGTAMTTDLADRAFLLFAGGLRLASGGTFPGTSGNDVCYDYIQSTCNTTDAIWTTITTIPLASNTVASIEGTLIGGRTGGVGGVAGDSWAAMARIKVKNVGGVVTASALVLDAFVDVAGASVRYNPSGVNILCQVRGIATYNITWNVTHRISMFTYA